MDSFSIIIVTCTIVFFICFVCGYCCKRSRRGAVLGPPVMVTTTHVTAASVEPPYPTNIPHPMPQPISQPVGSPGIGFSNYAGSYQATPYPPPHTGNFTPYPPGQIAAPPSYSEAMSQPVVTSPAVSELYPKQAPYNPNY